jgi:tetratricopeptide (TPR) repeat protein
LKVFLSKLEAGEHVSATIQRYLLEAAVSSRELDACERLVDNVQPLAPYLFTEILMCFCIGRHLGDAAAFLGRGEDARAFYEQAIDVSTRARFRPEVALSDLGLAEVLLDHYPDEHDAAIEHLDFAIAEFRDMKMQPALERALGRRGLLKA